MFTSKPRAMYVICGTYPMTTTPITQVSGWWDGGAHSHKRHAFSMNEPRSPLRKGLIDYQPVNLYVGGIEH